MVAGEKCQVEGCTKILKQVEGRICQMHTTRMFRHGAYELPPNPRSAKWGKPCLSPLGYLRITVNGRRMLHHRYVMEQHLGRPLKRDERIHHINGDRADNRIENLGLWPGNGEHMKKCHNDLWERRPDRVRPETIHQIIDRIHVGGGAFDTCFCGASVDSRNLCEKHYQWAYKHRLFKPNKNQSHYDGTHHSPSPTEMSHDDVPDQNNWHY